MTRAWRDRMVMVAPLVGLIALASVKPSDDGPTICPFALVTGTACPGCGLTRAASSLVQGDWSAAMRYHPLVPAIGLHLLAGWGWFVLRRRGKVGQLSSRVLNVTLIVMLIALVAVWAVRALSGTLPPV